VTETGDYTRQLAPIDRIDVTAGDETPAAGAFLSCSVDGGAVLAARR
jgi:hypothetical protein